MPGTTPTYGIPYPIATDPLDDAVSVIPQALATAVDNAIATAAGVAAPGAWQNATPTTGWSNYSTGATGYRGLQYRKVGSEVIIRGMLLRSGTTAAGGSTVFTLPVGFRPARTELLDIVYSNGVTDISSRVDVRGLNDTSPGAIVLGNAAIAASNYLSFPNLSFWID